MSKLNTTQDSLADRSLEITRVVNAPRELVFKAWTDPKHLINWWGPKGFTNTFKQYDLKPGGKWIFIMHGPEGDYPNQIIFDKIEKPKHLSYTHGSGEENDPGDFKVTVDFEDQGVKTKITMNMVFNSAQVFKQVMEEYGAKEGAIQTLDKLEVELAKM